MNIWIGLEWAALLYGISTAEMGLDAAGDARCSHASLLEALFQRMMAISRGLHSRPEHDDFAVGCDLSPVDPAAVCDRATGFGVALLFGILKELDNGAVG